MRRHIVIGLHPERWDELDAMCDRLGVPRKSIAELLACWVFKPLPRARSADISTLRLERR